MTGFPPHRLNPTYSYVNVGSFSSLGDRTRKIISIDDISEFVTHNTLDSCSTFFTYPQNLRTCKGYVGSYCAEFFPIDIDNDDLELALEHTRKILLMLENTLDLNLNNLDCYFSGHKGFHINIPAECFGGFEPSAKLNDIFIRMYERLELESDKKVYKRNGLLRLPNTLNTKSGKFKIPLRANEIESLEIEDILFAANEPRFLLEKDYSKIEENDNLLSLYAECKEAIKKEPKKTLKQPKNSIVLPTVNKVKANGVIKGIRNEALFELALQWRALGFNEEKAKKEAIRFNSKCNPPSKDYNQISNTVKSAYAYERKYQMDGVARFFREDVYLNSLKTANQRYLYIVMCYRAGVEKTTFKGHIINVNEFVFGLYKWEEQYKLKASTIRSIKEKFENDKIIESRTIKINDKHAFSIVKHLGFNITHYFTHKNTEGKD